MQKTAFLFFVMLFLSACVKYYTTPEGGYRVKNPKEFKYNKPKYTKRDKSLIDTDAIYLIDSIHTYWDSKHVQNEFVRFFPGGQVLFIKTNGMPSSYLINNRDVGTPGYFILKGKRIKIDMFQDLNGGQTGFYFGKVLENGDLMFYEQRPETFLFAPFSALERNGQKSFWKKIKVPELESYTPNW